MNHQIPHFFIVGAPKCGTTSLYEWLRTHPSVYAPQKEPCFFSQDIFSTQGLRTHIPSLEAYGDIFREGFEQGKMVGEATPKYLYSNQALSTIAGLRPDAKIIVCLRDSVDLAISLHSQKVKEGVEPDQDFARAWSRGVDPNTAYPFSSAAEIDGRINYYFWAQVGARLDALHRQFPDDSILIVLLAEIQSQPAVVYRRILNFLGLPDDGRSVFSAENQRVGIRNLAIHRALHRLRHWADPLLSPLHELRGGKGLGILRLANIINTDPGRYTSDISEQFRTEMNAALAEDIALAESFLNGRKLQQGVIERAARGARDA